jgi:signal peptidase I
MPALLTTRPFDALASLALAAAVAVALAVAVAAAAGVTPHVEASDSMRPLLRAGDVVWLEDVRAAEARVGDVIAFAHPDRGDTVLHRVVARRRAGDALAFTTRGDANTGVERWSIDAGGVVGRYAGVRVPGVGRAPLALVSALSGLVLAGLLLRGIWR